MSFFSTQKKEGTSAIIFLGSGSIEAGVFSFTSKIMKVDFFEKENFKFFQNINPEVLEKETFLSLDKILNKILKNNSNQKEKINKIFFVLGAPWYISTSISIDIRKNDPFFVNKDEIIKELEVKNVEKNANYSVVESRIVSILANGYEIRELKGKKAKHVSAQAISNLSEKKILDKINKTTEKYFPEAQIKIHTLPSISMDEISEKINKENYLLVLSEEEITEVCLVQNKKSIENISLPFGKNTFIRVLIEKDLTKDFSSADSILKMSEEGHLEDDKKEILEKIITETSHICLKILKEALFQHIKKGNQLESVAILSSSKEINPILKNIFNDDYINKNQKKDFVKILLSKNAEESSLFSACIHGIRDLYFRF